MVSKHAPKILNQKDLHPIGTSLSSYVPIVVLHVGCTFDVIDLYDAMGIINNRNVVYVMDFGV